VEKIAKMKKENIVITDNFLSKEEFIALSDITTELKFPWFYRYKYYEMSEDYIDSKEPNELDQFNFIHPFYENAVAVSPYMKQLNSLLDLLQPVAIFKITGNLLTRLPNIVQHPFHTDMAFLSEEKLKQWTTSIFYVNTNNGYTIFEDGTKVESVANRLLTFPANMKHTGTSCTDEKVRIVINFNYYTR